VLGDDVAKVPSCDFAIAISRKSPARFVRPYAIKIFVWLMQTVENVLNKRDAILRAQLARLPC
jgi:hypothetical protein